MLIIRAMNERHQRLREARERAGYKSATKAAEALGVGASTYRAHENGQNDFDFDHAQKYARFFRVSPTWLLSGVDTGQDTANEIVVAAQAVEVPVVGKVSASGWQTVEEFHDYPEGLTVPASPQFPLEWQIAYEVQGESLNRIARPGDRLVCLDIKKSGGSFKDGDLVIVERSRFAGQMLQRSAKRVRSTLRGIELWPESDDPAHQEPIEYRSSGEGDEVEVSARVLWILRRP